MSLRISDSKTLLAKFKQLRGLEGVVLRQDYLKAILKFNIVCSVGPSISKHCAGGFLEVVLL
jgi:hypothetical protein